MKPNQSEGSAQSSWVVADFFDVIVHLMRADVSLVRFGGQEEGKGRESENGWRTTTDETELDEQKRRERERVQMVRREQIVKILEGAIGSSS